MRYFVSSPELSVHDKSATVAGLLSIFLGSFGIHRFYLGRTVSGTLILLSTVFSFGIALLFWAPFTIVEGFILLRKRPSGSLKIAPANIAPPQTSAAVLVDIPPESTNPITVAASQVSHEQHAASTATASLQFISDIRPQAPTQSTEIAGHDLAIYDVSDIETTPIVTPAAETATAPPTTKDWTSQLELPYERKNLRIAQLREEVYNLYEQLAEYIDTELRQQGSSLNRLRMSTPQDAYSYYGNVLYTIFCIAEGHVTHHYIGSYGFDNSFSYSLLEARTDPEFIHKLKLYANERVSHLPPVSDEIKRAFGLTPSGLPVEWWDPDGQLREHHKLSEALVRILRITLSRSTKMYEIPEIRMFIFQHYLRSLAVLEKQLKETPGWKVRISAYLHEVFDKDNDYVHNPYEFTILNQILKLSEQAVRKALPYTKPLDITKEIILIRKTIPNDAANAVTAYAVRLEDPIQPSAETLKVLAAQNPSAWKYDLTDIGEKSLQDIVNILRTYEDPATIDKVAKEVVKTRPEINIQLIALYATNRANGMSSEWATKKLSKIVHPDQTSTYTAMVANKKPITIGLANELMQLTRPPVRRVVLNRDRMVQAVEDHNHAVRSVTDYLGDEEDEIDMPDVIPLKPAPAKPAISREALFSTRPATNDVALHDDQKKFLRIIISAPDGISLAEASAHAKAQGKMVNGYIQSVNKALYETFDDQVITQIDGKIMIEQEYREVVKELI